MERKMRTLKISLLVFIFSITISAQNICQQTNGPYGGTINSLAINSNGDIFCAAYFQGIFRSTDNGENWVKKNNGLTNFNIYLPSDFVINKAIFVLIIHG